MKIERAIEIKKLYLAHSDQYYHQDLDDAIQLGIEALKRIKSLRLTGKPDKYSILPGETEE